VTVEELRDALRHKAIEHGIAVEVRRRPAGGIECCYGLRRKR